MTALLLALVSLHQEKLDLIAVQRQVQAEVRFFELVEKVWILNEYHVLTFITGEKFDRYPVTSDLAGQRFVSDEYAYLAIWQVHNDSVKQKRKQHLGDMISWHERQNPTFLLENNKGAFVSQVPTASWLKMCVYEVDAKTLNFEKHYEGPGRPDKVWLKDGRLTIEAMWRPFGTDDAYKDKLFVFRL